MLRGELPGHTLTATAVAHEGFIRLVKTPAISAANMTHFFAIAAQVLRRVREAVGDDVVLFADANGGYTTHIARTKQNPCRRQFVGHNRRVVSDLVS